MEGEESAAETIDREWQEELGEGVVCEDLLFVKRTSIRSTNTANFDSIGELTMSPHQTIAVAVRLFAVWLVIYTARTAPSFYRESVNAGDPNASTAIIVIAALVVLVVLFLWSFPLTVARTLLDAKSPVAPEAASPDTWFAVGCALLGLWLIVPALAALVYRLSALYIAQRNTEIETSSTGLALVYYAAEIALGIWLLLGARGARRLFWWARHAR